MSKAIITESYLTDIADAIRSKNGESTLYTPEEMATAIEAMSSSGPYGWLGGGVEYVSKLYEWNGTLDDTTYSSWTPSTTSGTILAAQSEVAQFTIPDRTQETYYVITRWGMDFAYNSGTTMTYAPTKFASTSVNLYYNYPGTYIQYMSGDYSSFSNTTLCNYHYLQFYNSSGNPTGSNITYGPAYSSTSATWSTSVSGNSVTVTLSRPAISARCSTSYFTTDRAADIDTTNSTIKYRLDLFKGPRDDVITHRYKLLSDIFNNNWDF